MKKFLTILIITLIIALPISCVQNPPQEEEFFAVTFGGDFVEQSVVTVKKDGTVQKPQEPQREGYEFLFWAVDGKEFDFEQPITQSVVLHAVWSEILPEAQKYTVKFYGVDGQLIGKPQLVEEGRSAVSPAVSVSEFFVFDGWDKDFSEVRGDMEVYARERYDGINAEFFTYTQNEDMTYSITGIKKGVKLPQLPGGYVKLALPTHYQGQLITAIADGEEFNGAFSRYNILSVYIPSCYQRVGAYAFYGNSSLTQVTFCEGLKEIGEGAFMATFGEGYVLRGRYAHSGANAYVSALTQLKLPASLQKIQKNAFSHIGSTFEGGNYVSKQVDLEFLGQSNLSEIGEGAFEGVMLGEINLPTTQSGLVIGDRAFAADRYLNWVYTDSYDYPRSITKKITLPSAVEYIGDEAFYGIGVMSSFYNGACTDYAYSVDLSTTLLNVHYVGQNAFYGAQLVGSLTINATSIGDRAFFGQRLSSITLVGAQHIGEYAFARKDGDVALSLHLGSDLASIGEGAFLNNVGLSQLILPDTLVSIGEGAFEGCTSLQGEVVLPVSLVSVGNNAFRNCGLDSVLILGDVSIGDWCFESSSLKQISGNMSWVGEGAFEGCAQLTSASLPSSMTVMPAKLFANCISLQSVWLPRDLIKIGEGAFEGCSALETVTLPQSVQEIGEGAFEGCSALSDVIFEGNALTKVEASAFAMCYSLTTIELPDSVEHIGDYVFRGSGLTSFRTPSSLKSMGWRVFYQEEYVQQKSSKSTRSGGIGGEYDPSIDNTVRISLPVISSITISRATGIIEFSAQGTFDGSKVTRFEVQDGNQHYSAVDGILYSGDKKRLMMYVRDESVARINLPEGLEEIAHGTFFNNPYLYSVTLPKSLKAIGDYAFYNCVRLQSITLPDGLVSIGKYAFAGTANNYAQLSSINFAANSSLKVIGEGAFSYNKGLKSLRLPSSLVTLGNNAFYSAASLQQVDFSDCDSLIGSGSYAFAKCPLLNQINFGKLRAIDVGSFSDCNSITEIKIGNDVKQIGAGAFRNCYGLAKITVLQDNSLETIGAYAFAGTIAQKVNYETLDLTNATNLKTIEDFAFAYGKVRSVVLPDAELVLGEDVFNSCFYLSEVDLGQGIKQIGENVFRYCGAITQLNIPSSVVKIMKDAFRGLNLVTVNIGSIQNGNSIEFMGKNVFFDCNDLAEVNIYGSNVPMLWDGADNLSFHYNDDSNHARVNENVKIYIDAGMTSKYVRSGFATTGWEVYEQLISERK